MSSTTREVRAEDPDLLGCFQCTPGASIWASDDTFVQVPVFEVIEPHNSNPNAETFTVYVLTCGHKVI